ncbi:MAG TPA: DUF1549 and DUF1553 domain-containing protein [Planctomycetaceae bacterium]|jgi:hypothetical protein
MNTSPYRFLAAVLFVLCSTAWRVHQESHGADAAGGSTNADDKGPWAFQPVRDVAPPKVRNAAWPQSPVDNFILAQLEEQSLNPAEPADKRTLLRRATFDLTGLPPTPADIDEFLADESPIAFARVVDRLLASPRYGERWGRHWLDVVRYADARDLIQLPAESDFREAWRYRDWVVAAFNRDLPYDEFISRQLAGDLMQPADPAQIDAEALVATGMLAIADFVPGDVDKQQMIADYVNDQIDVVGRAFLGLTLACARCHDHKFDPISTADYYAMAGIFFSTRLVPGPVKGNTPLVRMPLLPAAEIQALEAQKSRETARVAELSLVLGTLADREYMAYLERRVAGETGRYLLAAWEYVHSHPRDSRPALVEFAKSRGLEEPVLVRWIAYFDEKHAHPAIAPLRAAADLTAAQHAVDDLGKKFAARAEQRRAAEIRDPAATAPANSIILAFRADNRHMATNEAGQVALWPNRGFGPDHAVLVPGVALPTLATADVEGRTVPTVRFSGKELLQVPVSVPPIGSLFVVFRPDPNGPNGQRLVGWEDSAVGQHGLGLMTDAAGAVHAILRKSGANGDVVVPAPVPTKNPGVGTDSNRIGPPGSPRAFQVLSVTWGPAGVVVCRNGQNVGMNKGIDSVSSDPAITALKIGGPGSGASSRFQGDLAELRVYAAQLNEATRAHIDAELTSRWSATPENPGSVVAETDLYEELISSQSPFRLEPAEREKALPNGFRDKLAAMQMELESLKKKPPLDIPRAVVVQDGGPPGTPHEGFHDAVIFLRGNHAKPGKTVPRGFPVALAGSQQPAIREGSGRRELVRWLTRREHPLTARVMVNRVWQQHFGFGLVRTSANFGVMGERPSHPELLDYLAARFVASGWSVKEMHRLMMLSSTYQQSTQTSAAGLAADPENRLLWRAHRRRLEAEAIRDSLFAVAGRLDPTPGGPGFQDASTPRRSLYLMAVRTGAKTAEFGPLFDAPDCSAIVERRNESIVAPQALFLLNDPLVAELAKSLAERIIREMPTGTTGERMVRLYEITLGRPPTPAEVDLGLAFVAEPATADAWARYCHLLVCTNEFMYVD